MGGWGLLYSKDGINLRVTGNRCQLILSKIVAHRVANNLPPDVDEVKLYLEREWYKRDAKRFLRKPLDAVPSKGLPQATNWKPGILFPFFKLASENNTGGMDTTKILVLQEFQKPEHPEAGEDILRDYYAMNPVNNLKDWSFGLYYTMMKHWNLTPKPKALIAREWNWNA